MLKNLAAPLSLLIRSFQRVQDKVLLPSFSQWFFSIRSGNAPMPSSNHHSLVLVKVSQIRHTHNSCLQYTCWLFSCCLTCPTLRKAPLWLIVISQANVTTGNMSPVRLVCDCLSQTVFSFYSLAHLIFELSLRWTRDCGWEEKQNLFPVLYAL